MSTIFCFADACSPLCCPVCMCMCVGGGPRAWRHCPSVSLFISLSHSYYTTPLSMQCIFKDVQIDTPPSHTLLIQQRVAAAQLA